VLYLVAVASLGAVALTGADTATVEPITEAIDDATGAGGGKSAAQPSAIGFTRSALD
jgi:hypothetical protein